MSYAPMNTYFPPSGDGSIRGCFAHKVFGTYFEFSPAWAAPEFNMKVWFRDGEEFRLAKVLKTVAYVVTDEDDAEAPVVERWPLKGFELYPRPAG